MTLTREEALDLLPLFSGGDIDDDARAGVTEALERWPDLRDELAAFEELDRTLRASLAPSPMAEPAWLAQPPPLVRRQCPYCKDDLATSSVVFCASCTTPHHQECFSENRGCSLLGCHGTRSIAADDPSTVVCARCGEHTNSAAPFCSWCASPLSPEAKPRHAEPVVERRADWRRFAATAAALLIGGLGTGWFVGVKNAALVEIVQEQQARLDAHRIEERARDAVRDLASAPASETPLMRLARLGNFGFTTSAVDVEASGTVTARTNEGYDFTLHFAPVANSKDLPRQFVLARAQPGSVRHASFFANQTRVVEDVGDREIDTDRCELVPRRTIK